MYDVPSNEGGEAQQDLDLDRVVGAKHEDFLDYLDELYDGDEQGFDDEVAALFQVCFGIKYFL